MRTSSSFFVATVVSSLALSACALDEEAPEDLSEAKQDVSWTSSTPLYGCSEGPVYGHNSCDFALNVPDDGAHVCVLNGIQGPISGNGTDGGGTAMIESLGGQYRLHIDTGYGSNRTVSASALCFAATKSVNNFWHSGNATTTLANARDSAHMMCFLSGLRVAYNGFGTQNDNVFVEKNELGQWQVGGTQTPGTDLAAYAQCVIPPGGAEWFYTYTWTGNTWLPLAPNDPPGGVVCGLNKVQGLFLASGDKVSVSYSALLTEWLMGIAGNTHTGDSYCMN
jgi:hypothetical protein